MEKEIIDELNRVADGFWYDKKVLDRKKIDSITILRATRFGKKFDAALTNFLQIRRFDVKNHDRSLDKMLSLNPVQDYYDACNEFLRVVTTAKGNDLIVDKEIIKELDECKKKHSQLEVDNEKNKLIIERQKVIIDTYKNQIKNAIEIHPKLAHFFGVQESKVDDVE